ncbi:benzoate/H(+) symporter BenE family transporter [Thiopseudomonas alkaliphila]|uniref:Benzoate/H(+) symporter BenE family transporter n=1 Tax=Thiopseudomonas alkaliphila TaxID=1697053 RepID=A0AAW7DVX4_9GAMM|nr:benzoate/H(+) symporter BenE family transporter [Thiopseudomonas alkaliphila]MDM1697153.1 benzoate/H(+) symporter BenE family transporter [Thiopseudomonas alkaliphila]
MQALRRLQQDFSFSSLVAGFIAVLTGYSSAAVIVFQAAEAAGASSSQISSWMWALGISMGLTTLGLSWRYKMPIITAWSTPGAALLVTSLPGLSMPQAIGAFLFSALLITLCGVTGLFARLMHKIPASLAAAMLAGILLQFGLNLFISLEQQLLLPLAMMATYLISKRYLPRYAIALSLMLGIVLAAAQQQVQLAQLTLTWGKPEWITPELHWASLLSVGLPLFIVTMASQNLPGVAVLQSAGYRPPVSAIVSWTGLSNLLLAPFGAYALNLAAISAAVCTSQEAHDDPSKRYMAGVFAGLFYLTLGILGGTVAGLFAALPKVLVMVIAGLALLNTIANGLVTALQQTSEREAAAVTFLLTASGITLFGIGAAFWGLIAGVITLIWLKAKD